MLDNIDLDTNDVLGEDSEDSSVGGPVAHWLIGSESPYWGTPTLRDIVPKSSGRGGNHGTLTNGPIWQGSSGRPGGWGALRFVSASSQQVTLSSSALTASSAFTLVLWVRPDDTVTGRLLGKGIQGGGGFIEYGMSMRSGGTFRIDTNVGGSYTSVDTTTTYTTGLWYNLAGVFDGTNLYVYLNGQQNNSAGALGTITAYNDNVQIGGDTVFAEYASALLDDVQVFPNLALSAAKVALLYDQSRRGYPDRRRRRKTYYVPSGAPPAAVRSDLLLLGVG